MSLPFAGIVTRRLAALMAALVLLAFAGVTAAAADTHGDAEDDATAEDTMYEVDVLDVAVEAEAEADGDDGDTDDDGSRAGDDADARVTATQATQAASAEPCTPMLVTHRADGSSGDQQAVAITAQAQEFGVAGWVNVAWQAADGAQLTALTITDMDGTVTTQTSGLRSGSAIDVLELRFCGSYDGEVSVDAGPPPSEDADDVAVDGDVTTDDGAADDTDEGDDDTADAEADDASASPPASTGGNGGSGGSAGSNTGANSDTDNTDSDEAADSSVAGDDDPSDDETSDEDDEPLGVVSVPMPDNDDDADDTSATSVDADVDEPETEVLGVQLMQDSSRDSGGGLFTAIGLLLLALVAGGGAFLGFRRLRA